MFSFAHLWRKPELSDVDVRITSSSSDVQSILIPAHKAILTASPYFKAQMERWLHPAGDGCSVPSSSGRRGDSCSPCSDAEQQAVTQRASLNVMLDNQGVIAAADQLVAAEAAIAAMYSASSLEGLTDSQLLSMAITADMLQLDDTAKQAVTCLHQRGKLASDAQQQFMALPVWPPAILRLFVIMSRSMPVSVVADAWVRNCCPSSASISSAASAISSKADVPLEFEMEDLLLDQLGNLDAVWTQPDLVNQLMSLPLAAVEMLLESDELEVSSEDNVLFTAQAYVDRHWQPWADTRKAAESRLACLICVPFLSKLWQSAPVLAKEPSKLLLNSLAPQLKEYMALTLAGFTLDTAKDYMTQPLLAECSSWFLGDRQYSPPPDGVELTWELPVSELKAASRAACTNLMGYVMLDSSVVTPPLHGVCWGLSVYCIPDEAGQGSSLSVCFRAENIPQGMYASSSYVFTISTPVNTQTGSQAVGPDSAGGWPDSFGVGVMAGGWDEAAWANKGLPTHGTLQLKLKVCHDPRRVTY